MTRREILATKRERQKGHVDNDNKHDGTEIVRRAQPGNVSCDAISTPPRCGKSAIRRAEIVLASRCASGPPGSAKINDANR